MLIFGRQGWPFLWRGDSPYLQSAVHLFTVPAGILLTYGCFFMASAADPGRIGAGNVRGFMRLMPYDHCIFPPKRCDTCDLPRYLILFRYLFYMYL